MKDQALKDDIVLNIFISFMLCCNGQPKMQ